jgi:hypothetical protein
MNPPTCATYAGRLLMALAAIASIVVASGCGNNNNFVPPNNNGFSNSDLMGTYVLSVSGTDVNVGQETSSFFAIVGAISADGNGNITGGTVDINDPDLGGVFTGQTVSPSTYRVTQDGRGTGTLVTPQGTFGLDFVLTSNSHGLITRFDTGGSGSGTLDLQGSATQTSLVSLAFSLSGADAGEAPLAGVGAFTLNSSGTITAGVQDFNDDGSSAGLTELPFNEPSSLVLSSSTFGTASLYDTNFGSLGFDVWVIDSTHLKLIETTTGAVLAGDAFTQQASFTVGQLVFTVEGIDGVASEDPVATGGYATTDVNGNLSAGLEDYNDAGNTGTVPAFTASSAPSPNGRFQLTTTAFTNGVTGNLGFAAYPSSGGVLLLEDDSLGLLQGAGYTQSATAFTAAGDYGFNLSGENPNGEVDDIAQFNTTTAVAPALNMSGVLDENDVAYALLPGLGLSGYYTPDSPVDGRGAITVPSIDTPTGTLNLEYYVVDASTVVFIDVDSDADDAPQVAVGTFEGQTASQSGVRAQSHIMLAHPVVRPHAAWRSKK